MKTLVTGLSTKARIVHTILFELLGVLLLAPITSYILDKDIFDIGLLAFIMSTMGMTWTFVYNILFDAIEANMGKDRFKRTPPIRILHAFLFEISLLIVTIPLIAVWLKTSLWNALMTDISFVVFYMVFAYIYNLLFDKSYLYLVKKHA